MRVPSSDIRARLEQWRDYILGGNGYPGASLQVMQHGAGSFCSKPPRGVEVPQAVSAIIRAMEVAIQSGRGIEIEAVRAWHLRRHRETEAIVARKLQTNVTTFKRRRGDGEAFLEGWLRCVDDGVAQPTSLTMGV